MSVSSLLNLAASNLMLKRFLPLISAFYRLMSYVTLGTGESDFMCTGNVLETLEFKISFEQVCLSSWEFNCCVETCLVEIKTHFL